MIHVDTRGQTGEPSGRLGHGVDGVAKAGKRTEWKGGAQGRRRNHQWANEAM